MAYDAKAQEFVYAFYLRGWSKERALPEIRKTYAGFSGSTWDTWEKQLDWKERRAASEAKLRAFEDDLQNTTRTVLLELNEVRARLYAQIKASETPDHQTVYAFNSVAKQILLLSKQHLDSRDSDKVSLEALNRAVEALIGELQTHPELGVALRKNAPAVGEAVSKVAERFGIGGAA